jgi:hypothetical protein
MRRIIFVIAVSVFLFSGIIQGPICTLTSPLGYDYDGYLNALKLDTVAWAKKPKEPKEPKEPKLPKDPIAVPEPSTILFLGVTLLGIVVLARKRFNRNN